jgi:G3E family GTPase
MLIRFPELGHTTRLQIEGADILLLNKIDLIEAGQVKPLETKLREINPTAAIVRTQRCRIDPEPLFGIGRERKIASPEHRHQSEFESFAFTSAKMFSRTCFEDFANGLPANVIRAKGFIRFADGVQLFNFVVGRWELESFEFDRTELVFIGRKIGPEREAILSALNECTVKNDEARMTNVEGMTKHELL